MSIVALHTGQATAIRTDNGVPFGSPTALYGLSRLAVWWLRLGIRIERIKPGHPEQNGRHERMHLTLKQEATKPAAANMLQQQARFDAFVTRYNDERPHQALDMKVPSELYTRSDRAYEGLGDLEYPFHDWTATVTWYGRICFKKRQVNLSQVFAGQSVGVKQVCMFGHDLIIGVGKLNERCPLSDSEVERLRDQLYQLARAVVHVTQMQLSEPDRLIAQLSDDERAGVEERAAILEFDGGLDRRQANRLAVTTYFRPRKRSR